MVPIKRWYNFAPKRQVAQQADVSSEDLERMVRHAHPFRPVVHRPANHRLYQSLAASR